MNKKTIIQNEALAELLKHKRCTAKLGTGVGKTRLGINHMSTQYHDTAMFLVAAPRTSVFKSWKDELLELGYVDMIPHITFVTYRSLATLDLNMFDVVYLDEVHNLKHSHFETLENYNNKILGLTGTYPKSEFSESGEMCKRFAPSVYEYNVNDAVKDGLINDYLICVHKIPLNNYPYIQVKNFKVSEEQSYNYIRRKLEDPNTNKMDFIYAMKTMQGYKTKINYVKKLLTKIQNKCLIFVSYKYQADQVCTHSVYSGNSKSEVNLELFKQGAIKNLATVDQLSEGINIPNLKTGIITHSFANERKLAQKIGRFLRLNPNDKCIIHLLCYANTIDEIWCLKALESFDLNKIKFYNIKNG